MTVKNVAKCHSTYCFQTLSTSKLIEQKELENGDTQYVYQILRRQGSLLRSVAYGTGAVFTFGVSEVLNGPIEGALQNGKNMAAVANCNDEGECNRLVIFRGDKAPYVAYGHTKSELAAIEAKKAK
ncbi:MAG TPA: hypothetical protein ENJ42_08900 [Hellea balneolensis]|uniref:Uncharacterized protein n=1 Tax=Hellea balneolensis TaxID=287478 RepID=A0A7C5R1L9_9PROT|nr:hypothetical protein [Hellea balneolensis]